MAEDPRATHRILARIEQLVRSTNRSVIDPLIPEITMESLKPIVAATAKTRGLYLEKFFEVSRACEGCHPSEEEIKRLRVLREAYVEMVEGTHALETAIERGYLSVRED